MLIPTILLLGNCLALAPAPQAQLHLPLGDGEAKWHTGKAAGNADQYGDPLPEGAIARIGTVRFHAANNMIAIAFSPDGKMVASAGHAHAYLWDAANGKLLATFTVPQPVLILQVAFLPRAKYLVTQTAEGRILFWALTPGDNRPLRGPDADKHSRFVLSPDGKHLFFIKDGNIHLWDVASGKEVAEYVQRAKDKRLALANDGKLLVSHDGSSLMLWDVPTGKGLRHFPAKQEEEEPQPGRPPKREPRIIDFDLSPDGQFLAVEMREVADDSIQFWEAKTGKMLRGLEPNDRHVTQMNFSPDGTLFAVAGWLGLRFIDVKTGKQRGRVSIYGGQIYSMAFSPDGKLLATGVHGGVRIWQVATGREVFPIAEQRDGISYLSLSDEGRTVVTASQLTVQPVGDEYDPEASGLRFWDATTGKAMPPPWVSRKRFPPFVALSKDQHTLATWGKDGVIQLWDVNSEKELSRVTYEGRVGTHALSDDGKLFVLSSQVPHTGPGPSSARTILWDVRTGKRLGEFKGQRSESGSASFSPDGKLLATVDGWGGSSLRLWDVATQKELLCFHPKPNGCQSLAFSRDGRTLAVYCPRSQVVFLEVHSGKELPTVAQTGISEKLKYGGGSLLLSPEDKRILMSDSLGHVFIWERESGRLLKEWLADPSGVSQLALSADGKVLITRGNSAALVWDVEQLLKRKEP